jgi:hypothetical protein
LNYLIKRALRLLVRHRRTLFGIKWLRVSYVFFALYVTMALGAVLREPVVSGVAYLLSGYIEERDIRPRNRRSRKLSGWRRGLEIRSQWRSMLFVLAMVAGGAAPELTVGFAIISLLAAFVVRIIRSRQLQLDTSRRITPLGALEAGRERLQQAKSVARKRDMSELPIQASVGVGAFFLSLPTATSMPTEAALALGSVWLLAAIVYLGSIIGNVRRLRPAMIQGEHDREVLAEFLSYDPEAICYFNGHKGSMYAVDVWLRTFEASAKRIALVFRHRDVRSIGTDQLPAIVVPRDSLCEKIVAPSTRVAFYPANGTLNIHMQRDPRLSHVFLGHGDSDKAGSASPATRGYDRIWVSGSAGMDRYQAAGLDIPPDLFDVIGRPPLSPRIREMEDARLVPEEGDSPFDSLEAALEEADQFGKPPLTILYAPTWEGYFDKSDYSSLATFGPELIESLLARHPGARIIYKPHPMNGRRKGSMRSASSQIRSMLAEDETFHPSTRTHSRIPLYRWFDYADILITDISSVLSDFMAWDRPYVVTNPRRLDISKIHADFPSTRAAYVIDGVDIELDVDLITNAINHDPMAERRHKAMERYLGDPDRDPMDMFDEQLDKLWSSQGAHKVDDETLILMGLKSPDPEGDDVLASPEDGGTGGDDETEDGDITSEAAGGEDVEDESEELVSEDG